MAAKKKAPAKAKADDEKNPFLAMIAAKKAKAGKGKAKGNPFAKKK